MLAALARARQAGGNNLIKDIFGSNFGDRKPVGEGNREVRDMRQNAQKLNQKCCFPQPETRNAIAFPR